MMRFQMGVTKPGFGFVFSGEAEDREADTTAMLMAMREGLEANGYNVDIVVKNETRFRL